MTTQDLNSPADMVRLLINDPTGSDPTFFSNNEIAAFLDLEGDSIKRAAALALETIASNEVLISKVIRTQDVATDGAKVSAELRARAVDLRSQAEDGDGFVFEIVEFEAYPYRADWLC